MTQFVVESVLQNLNSLIQKELTPFLSFHQDLRRLANMFTIIMASLEDAEEKQFSDTHINNWLQKINDAAHMVDDIIDECAYEALGMEYRGVKADLSDKVQCSCLSSFHFNHFAFRYKMAKKMKRISQRLIEIVEEKNKFRLTETGMISGRRNEVIKGHRTTFFFREPQVYGTRQEDQVLLLRLLDVSPYYSFGFMDDLLVYPIEGPEGIGKTTFAKLIFNHPWVVPQFELRIWVCGVSDFSFKGMIEAITKAAIGCDCEDLDVDLLQKKLQYLLQRKRYLLVFDFKLYPEHQRWEDTFYHEWQRLKSVLACGKKGATILVITSVREIAQIMGTVPPYEFCRLSVLSKNDCWELFRQQVCKPNENVPFKLEEIGKEIVQKCGGAPLAAKLVGGLLHFSREEKEWLNIMGSNIWNLPQVENSVTSALILSYLNLPIRLKKCFAYCAIFPKGVTIRKTYLIELWIANGFISSDRKLDAEDAGDDVWNELYRRSFFQDIETDEFGNPTGFRMHNLVIDFAILITKDVKCLIGDSRISYPSNIIKHLSDYRREIELNTIDLQKIKSLRTYLIPNQCSEKLSANVLKCHSLRVLELRVRGKLSPSIGDLKHLRYLNLSKSDFKTLPEFLCRLWNLQILKLDYCKHLEKLPNSLIDLKSLEKLSLKGCHKLSSLPPQMGKLTSLKSLTSYFVGKERGFLLAELGRMKLKGDLDLKHLGRVKSVGDAMEANMSSKRLKGLRLSWDKNEETKLGENVEEILGVLEPDSQQLVSLTVTGYTGGHFPKWVLSPYLKKLQIERCTELKGLEDALQAMTALQSLRLYDLPNLESLPDCFRHLHSLRQLAVGFCCKLTCFPNSLIQRISLLDKLDIYACPALESRLHNWPTIPGFRKVRVDGRLVTEDWMKREGESSEEMFVNV